MRRILGFGGVVLAVVLAFALPAGATWSVVGADPATGEVGVAIASCVPASQLGPLDEPLFLVALAPNIGAGVSQAQVNGQVPPRMELLLGIGKTPEEIIADVSSEEFDEQFDARQHGVVTLDGSSAGFTGPSNGEVAVDLQSESVAVQGNLLVSESVVNDSLAAFNNDPTLPLADRLVAALLAGSEAGGDSRCDQTALFAHVVVVAPGDDPANPSVLMTYGSLNENDNPVAALAADFADGERRKVVAPTTDGSGGALGLIGIAFAVVMVGAAIVFVRRSFRPTRYP